MAVVKIELNLDWLDEEQNIDELLKAEVVSNLQSRLVGNAERQVTEKVNAIVEKLGTKITEDFIHKTLESKIENMKIPYRKNGWGSEYGMIPISEFIGIKYEKYLTEKTLDRNGQKPRYSSDASVSISEYFIHNYLEKELTTKVSTMIQTARKDAEETIVKALENNLKDQLSADIINRLNIPMMLESLQNKATELEGGKQ